LLSKRLRIKKEIRVLGVDDGAHTPRVKSRVPIVGVVFRGGDWLDGVMSTHVDVDGFDATEAISEMIIASPHFGQLRVIMLSGITFAGFNVVDLAALNEATGLPVIVVLREKPDVDKVRLALEKLPRSVERLKTIAQAGEIMMASTKGEKTVYIQTAGILADDAQKIVTLTSTRSSIPEPLRVAHLIASGISSCKA
jgi:endonuclease V-like protein UPF0215 family